MARERKLTGYDAPSDLLKRIDIDTDSVEHVVIMDALRSNAHAIKGGAGTLLAKPLEEAAKHMEHLCKFNDMKSIPAVLDRVAIEVDRLEMYAENHE